MSDGNKEVSPQKVSSRVDEARRRLLRSVAVGGAVTCASLLGLFGLREIQANPLLRPPGALDEKDYLAACIKCGQCVQVCPVEAIRLNDIQGGVDNGVPHIVARDQACDFSCGALQCVLACPTGALSHDLDHKEQVRMGMARIVELKSCLAFRGEGFKGVARGEAFKGLLPYPDVDDRKSTPVADQRYDLDICDLCVRECPIENAIELMPVSNDPQDRRRLPVVREACVGCGVCEMICPVEPVAIRIDVRVTGRTPEGTQT